MTAGAYLFMTATGQPSVFGVNGEILERLVPLLRGGHLCEQ